tara:strand:+ start:28068 stop:28760 length:693 start_codon:yes stop_codon:yes gene_type:complete
MKLKNILIVAFSILLLSCGNHSNSEVFIEKATGRYLYNSDEVVIVYFEKGELTINWRGATSIKPLKVDENTFYVKEMNEKIQFITNPVTQKDYIVLVPKEKDQPIKYNYRKLKNTEKTPSEYFKNNEFDKALEGYLTIQKNDSLDSAINESDLNSIGYKELRDKNYIKALNIFKINMALYPASSNVYDSYADGMKQSGDTLQAIQYYKKSLAIDSGNSRAKEFIKKYEKK